MQEKIEITEEDISKRLDIVVSEKYQNYTRSFVKNMIDKGLVLVDGKVQKAGYKFKGGEIVVMEMLEPEKLEAKAEDIDFEIVFEDEYLLVINKPQGLVVHPCSSTKSGTLVNGLLAKVKDLSGINGVLRPGIIHRLDKNTSGLMLVAKNDFSHKILSEEIKDKTCHRSYLALVEGHFKNNEGKIETFIDRNKKDRKKMAVSDSGKWAVTNYKVEKEFEKFSLVRFDLETGRTHQIRVHCSHLGHSIVGDDVYGKKVKDLNGQLLHSFRISFNHPKTGERMTFECDLPEYFKKNLDNLKQFFTNKKKYVMI